MTENQLQLQDGKIITLNDQQFDGLVKAKNWLKNKNTFFTLAGYAGTGKEQPIDCSIQTPNGKKTIGSMEIGDTIFGADGELITITGIFPQGIKQSYKITFRDGTSTECGEEHLWNIWTHKLREKNKPTITVTTKSMIESGLYYEYGDEKIYKYSIPLADAVKYEEKNLPIHPYLFGLFLGDGTNLGKTPILSTPDIDYEIIEIATKLLPIDMEIHSERSGKCPRYTFVDNSELRKNRLNIEFKLLGLNVKSIDKFIPEIYLHSSISQRYELLRGLMDTDGTSRGNRIGFSTSSKKLMYDIIELVQSLGGIAIKNKDDNRSENTNYTINIKTFENPFKLKRKANNWKFSKKNPPSRHIFSIEKCRIVEQVCISVSSNDGLYLTDNFIVTHNTTVIKKLLDSYRGNVCVSAPTHKAKKVIIGTTGQEGVTLHSLLGLRPDLDLDSFNPNSPTFNQIAKPKIGKYELIVIDESSMINQDLYNLLKYTANGLKTKIIFMGDPAQIPPVGEKESVVFYDKDIEIHWLTKVERQNDGNPLLPVYDTLRNNLTRADGGLLRQTNINDSGDGIIFLDNKIEFRKSVINKFTSLNYTLDTDYVKVIAWHNSAVMASNKVIRNVLFDSKAPIVEVGDVLMSYRSVIAKKAFYNIIDNSTDYRITKRGECEENEYGIWGYRVQLRENTGKGEFTFRNVFIIDSSDEHNLHQFAEFHDFFKERGIANKKEWKQYYDFRRENMSLITVNTYRNGDRRPNSDVIGKDLDYGYAITGHKCQGSTYEHVLILADDIAQNYKIKERNQILYVALTRPTSTATLLTL
jgi:hypothetical protein